MSSTVRLYVSTAVTKVVGLVKGPLVWVQENVIGVAVDAVEDVISDLRAPLGSLINGVVSTVTGALSGPVGDVQTARRRRVDGV